MGKYITFSKNKYVSRSRQGVYHKRQNTVGLRLRLGNISLGFLIVVLIGILGLLYISQINSVAVAGYTIKEADKKIEDLKRANKELNLELARLQSVGNIKNESQRLQMVELIQANYRNVQKAVAVKK